MHDSENRVEFFYASVQIAVYEDFMGVLTVAYRTTTRYKASDMDLSIPV